MSRLTCRALLATVVLIVAVSVAQAANKVGLLADCECKGEPKKVFDARTPATIVVVARATKVTGRVARVKIRESLSGCLIPNTKYYVRSTGDCGIEWNKGSSYLLFLRPDGNGDYLVGLNDCDGSRLWKKASRSLKQHLRDNSTPCSGNLGPSVGLKSTCDCVGDPLEAFDNLGPNAAVVAGTVRGIYDGSSAVAPIKVNKVYAGCLSKGDRIAVASTGDCGVEWVAGEKFSLFLLPVQASSGNYAVGGLECDGSRAWSATPTSIRSKLRNNAKACVSTSPAPVTTTVSVPTTPVVTDGYDLEPDEDQVFNGISITNEYFSEQSCPYQEKCLGGPGLRKLLRFSAGIKNVGNRDFTAGSPTDPNNPFKAHFVEDQCHQHYHFVGFTHFKLEGNGQVLPGLKESFCLIDIAPIDGSSGPSTGYDCGNMGISAGWLDVYGGGLDCQWVDITDMATSGDYMLEIEVDRNNILSETSRANNVLRTCVRIDLENEQAGRCT
eukprot:m.74212 g.74212  ORF g.74212 m.74212 type:complete len:496 (+) comp14416_c1_seq1:130-1617(+)